MFELVVKKHFSAAHKVEGHQGKCRFLHGHNWIVEVCFLAEDTGPIGIAVEFSDMKRAVNEIIERFDHYCLNDLPEFQGDLTYTNPTAENIARHIYQKLEPAAKAMGADMSKVTIWETDSCCATYFKSKTPRS